MQDRATADFGGEQVLVIKIGRSLEEGRSLYDAVRVAWKLSPQKAEKAHWVVAASRGVVLDVFEAEAWLPATDPEFAGLSRLVEDDDRFGFVGRLAPDALRQRWSGKVLPPELMVKGASNPIRYVNVG